MHVPKFVRSSNQMLIALIAASLIVDGSLTAFAQSTPIDNKEAVKRIKALSDLSKDNVKDSDVSTALVELRSKIIGFDCDLPPLDPVKCKINEFNKFFETWIPFFTAEQMAALKAEQQTAQRKSLIDAVTPQLDSLTALERLDRLAAVEREAKRLTATLTEIDKSDAKNATVIREINRVNSKVPDKDKDAALSKIDPKAAAIFDAITGLKAAITLLTPKKYRINIVGAWYGDIDDIGQALNEEGIQEWRGGSRFCSATQAIRAYCQSKTVCYEPPKVDEDETKKGKAIGSVADIKGTTLCGFEPVPYADNITKGLAVVYRCVDVDDEDWRLQREISPQQIKWRMKPAHGPKIDPKDWKYSGDYDPEAAKRPIGLRGVVMRAGATAEIRCYRDPLP